MLEMNPGEFVDVPRPVLRALDGWRRAVEPNAPHPPPESPLVRRIWKGGRIARQGLSPDGVWHVVKRSAAQAQLGNVALEESGVPVETISRLLRHNSIAVTEKYLSKLPRVNEGAVLMSEALGLENEDWPGFE